MAGQPGGRLANRFDSGAGVRLRSAQQHSPFVQFPTEVEITSARTVQRSATSDDATAAGSRNGELRSVTFTAELHGGRRKSFRLALF